MEEEIEKDMTPILLEDLGMRFTSDTKKYKARYGLYQCQYCGKEFEATTSNVNKKSVGSCGCQCTKCNNPHGFRYHPIYKIWIEMKARCYNLNHQHYNSYGGRGIKVCERWLDIKNFIEDMCPSYKKGLSIDRIDVNGNYEPDNCRWATRNTQSQNTRDIMCTNTSGYRGVSWDKKLNKWRSQITVNTQKIYLGSFKTALEAAKAYERYVRLNNLEHNFTPTLTEEEIAELNKENFKQISDNISIQTI